MTLSLSLSLRLFVRLSSRPTQISKPIFSRGHATLHLGVIVGQSVRHNPELRTDFASLFLLNRQRLCCGAVFLGLLQDASIDYMYNIQ